MTLLQEETGVLGRVISSSPGLLCDDVHACFDAVLEKLLSAIISVHHDSVTSDDAIGKVKEATRVSPAGLEANNDLDLASVLSDGLDPVATYLRSTFKTQEEKLQTASRAWIAYGVTCVMLYVPSRPFDPALRPQVLRELFQRRRADLQKNLNALQAFQTLFTAQQSNLRINLVEAEIADMGFEPEALAIARPPVSQMGSLVEDFRTVLRIIQPLNGSGKHMDRKDRSLLERNIYQLLHRLADQYRGYADITVPLIGFLKAIRIGLAFASQAEDLQRASQSQERRVFKAFANFTPFISDQTVAAVETTAARYQLLEHSYFSAQKQASLCILGLYQVALRRGLKYDHQFDKTIFEEASYSLRRVYDLWKARLEIEQKEHSAKTSLYTYRRGKTEEETKDESELEDLFPTYEDADQQTEHSNLTAPQELAISLCAAHRAVFLDRTNSVHMLPSIMQRAVKLLVYSGADVHSNATFAAVDAFPSVILELSQMKDSITATSNPKASPSFYKDPNIAEAQRLVALVNRVKRRFQEIHNRWPEHATPIEVLRISEEALSFSISEPVTKYLTKLEKLHEGVHEWQRIASREFTAQPLYEELTKLIVSWRQLELRTWARLFDIETESYRRGAQSWWFVAYENLVVAPMSILDSGTFVDQHTKSLLETLEDFFTNSTLGQFETRLQLLEQFEAHLAFEVAFDSSTSPVHAALRRFIRHFSTFLQPVQDALLQGRQRLEKDVNDVLRLASWKDTTIDALKQSAKTSHRKLFRLVRKFRDLLGQPVRPFLQQWPQEPENAKSNGSKSVRKIQSAELKPQALEFCDLNVQNWTARPARFQNVASTLKLMRELASSDESKIQTPSLINALLEDLTGSVGKLQKETPLILTEDNAEVVKHLKTRKRRLFADTLKNLRQMGFKSNLPEEALSAQDSCAAVLASLPLPPVGRAAVQMEEAERYFHRSLHLMDHVRGVAREHSADLTPAEVSRSIAYLESMVQHAIQQSRQISSAATHVEKLRVLTTAAASIWNPENYKTKPLSKSGSRNLDAIRDQLFALLPLIRFCAQLCTAQLNLAQMASQGHPVLQMLDKWAKKFERMQTNSEVLPKLPKGVSSTLHEQYLSEVRSLIDGFQSDIAIAEQQDSMFRPLFKHLSPWLDSAIAEEVNGVAETAAVKVDEFQETLFKVIDRILASCQDLRTATTSLPTSEKSWFLAEQTSLERSLNALNAEEICGHVETLLEHLHGTKKDTLQKFSAMTATVLPIFQQHLTMFDDLLSEYISLHTSTCHLSSRLTEIFILVGTKGFCTPPDKSRGKEDTTDQLEEGTGLGEGEGAEDISKDVNDDEDLSDLAQQPGSKQDREEIEDEKDAVDMADEGMEGEMGDVSDKGEDEGSTGSGEEDEKDIEEEVGEVDDLGASTVDEKMWDDGGKAEKEKEGKKGLGKKEEDQAAAQENGEERVEEDVEPATEEVEEVARDQMETADPKMKEEDTLDLPEDMDMDGKPEELSDVASSEELDFSDAEQDAEGTVDDDGGADTEEDAQDDGMGLGPDEPVTNEDEDDNSQIRDSSEGVEEQKDPEQRNQEDEQILTHQDTDTGAEDAAQSDEKGVGNDVQQDSGEDKSSTNAAQQAQGTMKEGENEEPTAAGENGTKETSQQDVTGRNEENDSAEQQAFRKLGDTLERWYNQQRQIREPAPEQNEREQAKDTEMADVDFEHLPHADATADTQALGSAAEDQAHALDESRAMEVTEYEEPDKMSEDDFEEQPSPQEKEPDQRHTPADTEAKDEDQLPTSRKSQAFVGDPKEHVDLDANHSDEAESESDVDNVDTQLSTIQLGSSNSLLRSAEEARSLWAQHEASTRTLALSLTEHLRLILAPTLATKMRGDFRTGKRLNIKRIIPYVASQYKRDKIWMRRSVPSKRSYQIMLALDDSKSMAESGTVTLAFETLALVARALTMLEAGEVSVVGFGEVVEVAHEFGKPLSSEAGAEVFRRFGFSQTKTDVRKLIAKSLELFREARMRASGSGAELWQLQLIISDGICEDHSTIQRLVRQAQEERIMVVFVIVDAAAKEAATGNGNQTPQSIMDLQTAEFGADENGEMKLIRRKYLDTFPFRWWIVVRDVNELPGVLATALRQWFAEVVDSAG